MCVCPCIVCIISSIYRCEALDDIVSYTRPGQETPDEFVRIDIRGKAFVYVSIGVRGEGGANAAKDWSHRSSLCPGLARASSCSHRVSGVLVPVRTLCQGF